jgi:hypothetical protein
MGPEVPVAGWASTLGLIGLFVLDLLVLAAN